MLPKALTGRKGRVFEVDNLILKLNYKRKKLEKAK